MALKQKTTRDTSLDFVKGFCVVGMIIHHSLDYFALESALKIYFRFITGSFIFIAGYIITSISLNKYAYSNKLASRLAVRGLKLLILFSCINFLKSSLNRQSITNNVIFAQFPDVFITGSFKLVAFELLVPIAYVLMFIGIILWCFRNPRWVIVTLAVLFFVYSTISFYNLSEGFNFRFFSIGITGAAFGFIPRNKLFLLHKHWIIVTCCFILCIIFLTFKGFNYPFYVVNVVCNLLFIYMISSYISTENAVTNSLIKLGNYTLISYLVQILILQILVKIHSPISHSLCDVFVGFIVTLAGTYMCIVLVNYCKTNSRLFVKLYRLIFA